MSQYCIIVNPAKREFISANDFGENIQLDCFPNGGSVHIKVLTLLTCHIDSSYWLPPAGSWTGDAIVVAGDESEPNWYGFEPSPNEKEYLSLYEMASKEFGNISHKAIVMLCEAEPTPFAGEYETEEFIPMLVRDAEPYWMDRLFLALGNAVSEVGCKRLEEELLRQYGSGWVERYEKLRSGMHFHLG